MATNDIPATTTAPNPPEQSEDAIWIAYHELKAKYQDALGFMKAMGVYELYEPKKQYNTIH